MGTRSERLFVSPEQYEYYTGLSGKVRDRLITIKRMMVEFGLEVSEARHFYQNLPDSLEIMAPAGSPPYVPSHFGDKRIPYFVSPRFLARIQELFARYMEAAEPETFYGVMDKITPKIREDVTQILLGENVIEGEPLSEKTIRDIVGQYPMGIWSEWSSLEGGGLEQIRDIVTRACDKGEEEEVIAALLRGSRYWPEHQRTHLYVVLAGRFYEKAKLLLKAEEQDHDNK